MGLFDKIKSALGGIENKSAESSALDKLRELKRQMGMDAGQDEQKFRKEEEIEKDDEYPDTKICNDDEDYEEVQEDAEEEDNEDDEEVDEEDEDMDELNENRAKPIFIINLKRFDAPLTSSSIHNNRNILSRYNHECILMRDKSKEPNLAHCFFDEPVDQLMDKALSELKSWIEDEEEDIKPVVDIVTDARAFNCDIDDGTFRNVVHYLVNEFGEVAEQVEGNIPYKDSLIRIIEEVDGIEKVHDYLAYPDWAGLDDDDDEHWVSRMIADHGIGL